jgi:hypothetical protein
VTSRAAANSHSTSGTAGCKNLTGIATGDSTGIAARDSAGIRTGSGAGVTSPDSHRTSVRTGCHRLAGISAGNATGVGTGCGTGVSATDPDCAGIRTGCQHLACVSAGNATGIRTGSGAGVSAANSHRASIGASDPEKSAGAERIAGLFLGIAKLDVEIERIVDTNLRVGIQVFSCPVELEGRSEQICPPTLRRIINSDGDIELGLTRH